ncbi:MAG: hypothetical protein M3Y41_16665, partial [Pseudomonadota bacterium]|nr:hypothetical protein [Pseudomonadota bacterium]
TGGRGPHDVSGKASNTCSESHPLRPSNPSHRPFRHDSEMASKISPVLYTAGILLAFVDTRISDAVYAMVALMWFIPDRRIEGVLRQ